MEKLKLFENPEFGTMRTIVIDDEPWFVGKDAADILGYSNPRKAIIDHVDDDDKTDGVTIRDSIGREQKPVCINESGLYSLILSSKLPSAKKFKHWVTSEVLPSIRKHGAYMTPDVLEKAISNPDFVIGLLENLKNEKNARIEAERKNAILMHTRKTYTATEIAKELGFKSAIALNKDLCAKGVQFKNNKTFVLYSKYADLGYTSIKQEILDNGHEVYNRRFTQEGRDFILSLYKK